MPETDYSFERRLVFQLRLKDFARKHKSLRHLGTFYARQINRLPILFFGKGTDLIRSHPLDLDAQRTLQVEQF